MLPTAPNYLGILPRSFLSEVSFSFVASPSPRSHLSKRQTSSAYRAESRAPASFTYIHIHQSKANLAMKYFPSPARNGRYRLPRRKSSTNFRPVKQIFSMLNGEQAVNGFVFLGLQLW